MTWIMARLYPVAQAAVQRAGGMLRREDGQGLTEYALIIALIAVVVIGAVLLLGNQISNVFTHITNCLGSTNSTTC